MTILFAIFGVVGLITSYFFHSKAQTAKALVNNVEATTELKEVDTSLAKNEGTLEAEALKRETNEVPDASKEDLVDFVNRRLPPL